MDIFQNPNSKNYQILSIWIALCPSLPLLSACYQDASVGDPVDPARGGEAVEIDKVRRGNLISQVPQVEDSLLLDLAEDGEESWLHPVTVEGVFPGLHTELQVILAWQPPVPGPRQDSGQLCSGFGRGSG